MNPILFKLFYFVKDSCEGLGFTAQVIQYPIKRLPKPWYGLVRCDLLRLHPLVLDILPIKPNRLGPGLEEEWVDYPDGIGFSVESP